MIQNRRRRRSTQGAEALAFYFDSLAEREGLEAVALVDAGGELVAGAGIAQGIYDLDEIARAASLTVEGSEPDQIDEITQGSDLYAVRIEAAGKSYVVTSLGKRVRRVQDAAKAIERIYAPPTKKKKIAAA
ncbi:MAG TPA: hypothetical protein VF407_17145 [Polyangiaceae bacterium]